jgi:hypothetical protein
VLADALRLKLGPGISGSGLAQQLFGVGAMSEQCDGGDQHRQDRQGHGHRNKAGIVPGVLRSLLYFLDLFRHLSLLVVLAGVPKPHGRDGIKIMVPRLRNDIQFILTRLCVEPPVLSGGRRRIPWRAAATEV